MNGTVMCRPRGALIAAWLVLIVLVAWLSLRRFDSFQTGTYRDDALYVILARSLAANHPYALDYMPGPPRPTKYSFGFPMLLVPFVWWWPDDVDAGRGLALGATLVNVSLLFWGWRLLARNASPWHGPAVATLYGLSPLVIGHSRVIMSEAVFTTFCLTALLWGERCAQRRRWGSVFVLGVSLAAAFCTRVTGLLLGGVIAIRLALELPRAVAVRLLAKVLLVACAFIATVMLLTPIDAGNLLPQRYVRELGERWAAGLDRERAGSMPALAARLVALPLIEGIRTVAIPVGGGAREAALAHRLGFDGLPVALSVLVTFVILLGMREGQRTARVSIAVLGFEIMHLASLAVWSRPIPRLLYPIQPFLISQLLLGVAGLARAMTDSRRFATVCVWMTWAALAALSVVASATSGDSRQFVRDFRVGTEWLRTHSASDAVVMANEPAIMHLYADRKTLSFPAVDSADALDLSITDLGVDYVLLGPRLEWNADGTLQYDAALTKNLDLTIQLAQRGRLSVVYESVADKVTVYQSSRARQR